MKREDRTKQPIAEEAANELIEVEEDAELVASGEDGENIETDDLDDAEEVDTEEFEEDENTIVLELSSDVRRRLERRAERAGVSVEELAEDLLSVALHQSFFETLPDLIARVEKLERRLNELSTTVTKISQPDHSNADARTRSSSGDFRRRDDFGPREGGDFRRRDDFGPREGRRFHDDRDRGGYGYQQRNRGSWSDNRPERRDRPGDDQDFRSGGRRGGFYSRGDR